MAGLVWVVLLLTASDGPALEVARDKPHIVIEERETGNTVLRYRAHDTTYKPYVEALYSPGGVNVLRDGPADHVHHHALMFAIQVDGVNYWEEYESPGHQVGTGLYFNARRSSDPISEPQFNHFIAWRPTRDGDGVLREDRSIAVCRTGEPEATLLTWTSTLVPSGDRTLEGSHYHGLGMRFVESMDAGGTFRYGTDREGEHVRGSEYLTAAPWCAYTAEADGKTVTVAMFDGPNNPRPVLWFTMTDPFAYLSATINLWREPLVLGEGETTVFRYGVAVWDGDVADDVIVKQYESWKAGLHDTGAAEPGE